MRNPKRPVGDERALRDETRSRLRLLTVLLTGYGTALMAGTALQTYLMNGKPIIISQIAGLAAGLAFHAFAMYIQPKGDAHVARH